VAAEAVTVTAASVAVPSVIGSHIDISKIDQPLTIVIRILQPPPQHQFHHPNSVVPLVISGHIDISKIEQPLTIVIRLLEPPPQHHFCHQSPLQSPLHHPNSVFPGKKNQLDSRFGSRTRHQCCSPLFATFHQIH
jgi:hypothetical protein